MPPRGTLFDIQRFSIHDGPGIRTTVFLKGCPLRCLWCHNPESQKPEREISFTAEKCIGCGGCFAHCPHQAHEMRDGEHIPRRDLCTRCGICAKTCYAKAIEVIGREVGVEETLAEVLKDKPFYDHSGGGMTLSGGEPMMQFEFTAALLRAARTAGLHTCMDTSGCAPIANYLSLLDTVDIFLYDIKDTHPERHARNTGVPLQPILDNLERLDKAGAKIILRCPLIPGVNADDEHIESLPRIAHSLQNLIEINLLPYHPLGQVKTERLGIVRTLPDLPFPDPAAIDHWRRVISAGVSVPVRRFQG